MLLLKEYYKPVQMLNSNLREVSTSELIVELIARGFDPETSLAEQLQTERKKIIPFPKSKVG